MAEVPQQPPQTFGAAHVAVGDDEDAVTDACLSGCARELVLLRQRMSSPRAGRRRKVGVDVEKACARDVTFEIQIPAALRLPEVPAAVDELVAQGYQLPPEGGSATEAGWIT
jgi:hypothetical protein